MNEAITDLLLKMGDDALVLGHRNSEWTGLGPVLEEDIAFSSMAQDKIGHAIALYNILHEDFGAPSPDDLAYKRKPDAFRCCHFVELPIGEYDFSLVRHFFFDHAEACRYRLLEHSSNNRLAALARKVRGEIKYHVMHADTWIKELGQASTESRERIIRSIQMAYPYALGIFEPCQRESDLITSGIFPGEEALRQEWLHSVQSVLEPIQIALPQDRVEPVFGGRKGVHTPHLQALLDEMTEVHRMEPDAEW
ncbi:MAG: phenylacetate-CoA oxygenase subunit PaaI [Chitinophagales bacterium]|nr:MAG: phenylacetate-CoA oxygenase subunit PaaI [Chitinophagales bacterium]